MNKTPAVRFKGFTEEWEQRKLGEVASSFEYGLNAAAKEFDGVNKYLRITDIDDSSRVFKDDDLTSPAIDLSTASSYQLNDGEILFARTGASVGKSFIYRESDGLVYYAGFLIRAKVKPEYDSEFIFQNTLGASYEKYIQITSQRSGQPGVNAQEYAEYTFLVPDYTEQKKIGGFLRRIDDLITLHQRKYEKLVNIKKSMLYKMFPQNGSKVPEIRFAGFTDDWEQQELGNLVQLAKGTGYSKSDLKETGTPIILYGRLYTKYETVIENVDTFADEKSGSVYSCGGEVIVPASGETAEDIAIASVVKSSGVLLGGDLNVIYPPKFIDSAFLAISISNGKPHSDMTKMAQGKTVVHLHNTDLEKIILLYPNYEEQIAISNYFNTLDELITLTNNKLEKLKQLKQAMLHKMFV